MVPHLILGKSLVSWVLTEPGGCSDAFGLKTNDVKSGDYWILNGSKTFITNPSRKRGKKVA